MRSEPRCRTWITICINISMHKHELRDWNGITLKTGKKKRTLVKENPENPTIEDNRCQGKTRANGWAFTQWNCSGMRVEICFPTNKFLLGLKDSKPAIFLLDQKVRRADYWLYFKMDDMRAPKQESTSIFHFNYIYRVGLGPYQILNILLKINHIKVVLFKLKYVQCSFHFHFHFLYPVSCVFTSYLCHCIVKQKLYLSFKQYLSETVHWNIKLHQEFNS